MSTDDELTRREKPVVADDDETRTVDGEGGEAPRGFPIPNWDRYQFVQFLGKGGMGAVYKARDPQLSRHVALKFLMRTEGGRAKRFVAEARAQAKVEHQHVCKVYEVGTAQGVPYIAMQFIDGVTLSAAQERMTIEDKVHVMRKVADAVHAAHQGGLIHRDLKRSNVMVERTERGNWQPFVLDFGLAREVDAGHTVAGEVAGTPAYMAPEQARGERADRRTDVWGLGATLYALLAGRPPNHGTTAEAFASLVTKDVPSVRTVAPQIPGELATIVMKCLEADPARRYADAGEVAADLRRYLAGEPIHARPRSLVYRASKRLRRSWAVAAAIGVALVAAGLVAVMWARAAAQSRLAEKRVQIAQHFGQEVARLETLMRQAYTAPLHDTRREKQQVLARMAAIEKEAKQLGDVADGPAEYALGRGELSLHDYAAARTHLDRAAAASYDTPELQYAKGLAYAALYKQGLGDAERMHDKVQRAAKREELKKTLRDPALAALRHVGETSPEAAPYAEGLVALYEGDTASALAKAAAAEQAAPWFYEAHELAADAYAARAADAREKGAYTDATADLERAGTEYATAMAAAPSDATLLEAECKRRGSGVSVAMATRKLEKADIAPAIEPCDRARQADPDDVSVMIREAYILADAAQHLAEHRGEKPDDEMALATPLLDRALALEPNSARAHHARSELYAAAARVKCDHREDCEADVDTAIAALRRVIEIDPTYSDAYSDIAFQLQQRADRVREAGHDARPIIDDAIANVERGIQASGRAERLQGDLASLWQARADYEAEHSIDPSASLGKSIAAFEAALAINPNDAAALNNMGLALQTRAYYRLAHGQPEGEADLDRATQTYQRVVALGGTDSATLANLGYVDVDRADQLARTGRDPKPAVDEGVAYEQRALAANPNERFVYFNTAGMELTLAEYQVEHGQDPAEALAAAEAAVAADVARSKQPDADIIAYESNAHVLAARWAIANKRSPAADFAAADKALARAEQLDPASLFVLGARVDLERWKADALAVENRDPAAHLARARAAVAKITETDHGSPAIHLWLGQLAAIEARALRTTKGAEARRDAALATAKQELAAAVAGNRFYETRVAAILAGL
ncbi:MAG: protein kinase [Deltaproteobacteria bacterium]|nr:protein kinase [Deltaproteobacteria bacterium]